MSNNLLKPSLNRARGLVCAAWAVLVLGLLMSPLAHAQTLLYQWNFDNAVASGSGGTNITVAPTVIDSGDGYVGGTLTSFDNAGGTVSTPAGSGVYGSITSTDLGFFNSLSNGQANGGVPANGGLTGGAGNLSAITNQFTVTMWFKLSALYTNTGNARLFCIDSHTANNGVGGVGADGNELYIDLASGSQAIQIGVNNPGQSTTGGNGRIGAVPELTGINNIASVTNIWFFVACVYSNAIGTTNVSVQVYVGRTNTTAVLADTITGALLGTSGVGILQSTNAWNNTTNLFLIGNRTTDGKRNLPGTIDDVRLYKEALTLAQVQAVQGVITLPVISVQPTPVVVFAGQTPKFSVTTTNGSVPVSYQWMRNGTNLADGGNISGSTSNVLTITGVSSSDVFSNYVVVITNAAGAVTSSVVSLSLTYPNGAYEKAVLTNAPFAFYTFSETNDPGNGGVVAHDSIGAFNGVFGLEADNGFDTSASAGGTFQFDNNVGPIAGPRNTADSLIGFNNTNTALFATTGATPTPSSGFVTAPPFNLNNGLGTNVLTITAWINPSGPQAHARAIVFSRSGTTTAGLVYNATNGDSNLRLGYIWNNDGATVSWDSGLVATPGIWSLVSLVVTPTNATIYVVNPNGLQFSTFVHTNVNQIFEGPTLIGADSQGGVSGTRTFNGTIDEVALFNQALTASQMSVLYAVASGTTFAPQPPSIITQPSWPSPIFTGQSASATVTSIGGLYFQWEAGLGGHYTNLTDGLNISGSASATLTISNAQPTNALDYIVVVSNSFGSIASSIATLVLTPPGPATNFTLNYGGTAIVEAGGEDWNTVTNWAPGGLGAANSLFGNPGSTFEVVTNSRLRTPVLANAVFPGTNSLVLDGDGVYEDNQVTNTSELRIKHTGFIPATNYYARLVLSGGEVFNGDTGPLVLQGRVDVQANGGVFYNDVVENRSFQIDSWLTGSGNIFWHDATNGFVTTNGLSDFNVTGTTNTFHGQWILDQGGLLGSGLNSLGTNSITVGTGTNAAAVETLYDLNNTNASLILGVNGKVYLHQNDHFASVSINGTPLANGVYSFVALTNSYPANFPATWTQQLGSTITNISGQIVVGNVVVGPPSAPRITGISLSGTSLTLSATNGSPSGSWALLQSTNVALPLSQWQTNTMGGFDGSGNLSTNLPNTATNLQEFYILKVQ